MNDYEDASGFVSDEAAKRYFDDAGLVETENGRLTLFILRDGTMIGDSDEAVVRSTDHNVVEDLFSEVDDENKCWPAIHAKAGLIRVVPETGEALIAQGQELTAEQQERVEENGWQVDEYVKDLPESEWIKQQGEEIEKESPGFQNDRQLDLENLKALQEEGKIKEGVDLEKIADQLPAWRESNLNFDRIHLAEYGRDQDLDKLVNDPDEDVRAAVTWRGRDKDLDILANDKDEWVRESVAYQGRDKDLDRLVSDKDWHVRSTVAEQGRDKDLDKLAHDEKAIIRSQVAEQREKKQAEASRDVDPDILAKRREAARRGLER